jgi:hypothetical protein
MSGHPANAADGLDGCWNMLKHLIGNHDVELTLQSLTTDIKFGVTHGLIASEAE